MIGFLTGNWQRVLVYAALIAGLLAAVWFWGYAKGNDNLYEYQAKQATKAVAVIAKIKEADDVALTQLQRDYDGLRVRYDAARRARPLSAAASAVACPSARTDVPAVQGDGDPTAVQVRDAARMLDDVEGAVLAILAAGDTELAKCRRLFERDVAASKAGQ